MRFNKPLPCPDPAISVAMLKMLNAIDSHRPGGDATTLAFRSAQLVGTVRRCLAKSSPRNLHCDLRLAAAIEDYERRWSSSALIGGRFDLFQRDSRRFLAMLEERLRTGAKGEYWSAA